MDRTLRMARRFASGALTTMVCLTLAAFIAWFTIPRIMGWTPLVVLSGSMEPTLPLGGVTFVEPKPADQIEVGDVMTFVHPEKPGVLVTHRVTSITGDGSGTRLFKTKGDANNREDGWTVRSHHVVGTAKFTIPYVGHVTTKVQTPYGFLVLVGIPAAYLAIGEVRSIVEEVRRHRAGAHEGAGA